MKKPNSTNCSRLTLGTISRSTLGGIRGTVELVGLFTPGIRLD